MDVSELPDKSATQYITPLLKALNSDDSERLESFVRDNFDNDYLNYLPLNKHVERLQPLSHIEGDLSFHSSRDYLDYPLPENEIHVVFKPEDIDFWLGFIIVTHKKAPHKITNFEFVPARRPSNLPKHKPMSMDEGVAELRGLLELMSKMDLFSGTVLLAQEERVLYQSAFGEASKRFSVANSVDTKFNLGSIDKMFTSVAIMQLVDAGKVSLTDKLTDIIDDSWLNKEISDKIEIQHLLTHSSGLGSNFLRPILSWPQNRFRALADYKVVTRDETQYFEPGTNNRYSNTGMFLLGVVIEAVSGQDYFSYIRDNIYQKAGMTDSGSFEMSQPVPNLAIGYHRDYRAHTGWHNNLFDHVAKGSPAGGSFSTVVDMHLFALALKNNKLLSKVSTEMALTAKPVLHSEDYGYGFSISESPLGPIIGHEGGTRGINSNIDIYLQTGYVAVVMSNYTDGAIHVKRKLRDILSRTEFVPQESE